MQNNEQQPSSFMTEKIQQRYVRSTAIRGGCITFGFALSCGSCTLTTIALSSREFMERLGMHPPEIVLLGSAAVVLGGGVIFLASRSADKLLHRQQVDGSIRDVQVKNSSDQPPAISPPPESGSNRISRN